MSEHLLFERPTDITGGPAEFFLGHIDTITGGVWGSAVILIIFALTYLGLNQFNPRKAFAAASFTAFVTTVMMIPIGVAGDFEFIATLMAVVLSIIINSGDGV